MSSDVSVIIPTYNSSGTLRRALDSVYSQSLLPREIIIVDDGSDDWQKSKMIAESYPDSIYLRFIRVEKNKGASVARNVGMKASSCLYIAFLDSDDVWYKEKIDVQYRFMVHNKTDLSMHGYIRNLNHARTEVESMHDAKRLSYPLSSWGMMFRNHGSTPTVMVLKEKMVPFDTLLRRCEDWKCWVEVLSKDGVRGEYINRFLAGGFKPSLGFSGLSHDVKAMHISALLALKRLLGGGSITIAQYIVGTCMETVKYPVRTIRVRVGLCRIASRCNSGRDI